jgi:hypothetical protein
MMPNIKREIKKCPGCKKKSVKTYSIKKYKGYTNWNVEYCLLCGWEKRKATGKKMPQQEHKSIQHVELPHQKKKKTAITVNGKPHPSVTAAFRNLKLPMGDMVRIRAELKKKGKLTYKKYKFKTGGK